MIDDKYPKGEYKCNKCKTRFTPAFFPVLCRNCGSDKVISCEQLKIPARDWSTDPSYFEYIMKKTEKQVHKDVLIIQKYC